MSLLPILDSGAYGSLLHSVNKLRNLKVMRVYAHNLIPTLFIDVLALDQRIEQSLQG